MSETIDERKKNALEALRVRGWTVDSHLKNAALDLSGLDVPEFAEAGILIDRARLQMEKGHERLLKLLNPDVAPEILESEAGYQRAGKF